MERAGKVHLNILGIREDEKWCAIALEMSLRGYGETLEEALDDLKETIIVQVKYALEHHNAIDHILIDAEPHYFDMYAIAKREALRNSFSKRVQLSKRVQPPPAEHVIRSMPLPRIKRPAYVPSENVPAYA